MEKLLITGGAGYIGSHTVSLLKERGYKIVVIDNLINGHKEALPKDVTFYNIDLQFKDKIEDVFKKEKDIKGVIHFAAFALVGESVKYPLKYYNNNVKNTLNLLDIIIKYKIKIFIFSSTAAVYGEPKEIPIKEDHPKFPINPYGRSKLMIEWILEDLSKAYEFNYCSLRYFNAAGAHPNENIGEDHNPETHLIPRILKVALKVKNKEHTEPVYIFGDDYPTKDGTCIRDYIHVMDLAEAHVLAYEYLKKHKKSEIFNLGNGAGYSIKEVLKTAENVCEIKIPYKVTSRREGDPAKLVASSEKIKKVLKWIPKYDKLEDIIKHAWRWHVKNPNGYKKNK